MRREDVKKYLDDILHDSMVGIKESRFTETDIDNLLAGQEIESVYSKYNTGNLTPYVGREYRVDDPSKEIRLAKQTERSSETIELYNQNKHGILINSSRIDGLSNPDDTKDVHYRYHEINDEGQYFCTTLYVSSKYEGNKLFSWFIPKKSCEYLASKLNISIEEFNLGFLEEKGLCNNLPEVNDLIEWKEIEIPQDNESKYLIFNQLINGKLPQIYKTGKVELTSDNTKTSEENKEEKQETVIDEKYIKLQEFREKREERESNLAKKIEEVRKNNEEVEMKGQEDDERALNRQEEIIKLQKLVSGLKQVKEADGTFLTEEQNKKYELNKMFLEKYATTKELDKNHEIDTGMNEEVRKMYQEEYSDKHR